jgi:hypothetical protein
VSPSFSFSPMMSWLRERINGIARESTARQCENCAPPNKVVETCAKEAEAQSTEPDKERHTRREVLPISRWAKHIPWNQQDRG